MSAPRPENEAERLAALYAVAERGSPEHFDDLTYIASQVCEAPIALLTMIGENKQWFRSKIGIDIEETDRDVAFCSHAILYTEPLVVADTTADERFRDNPLVTQPPFVRFYAGAPIAVEGGFNVGTVCVIDTEPRTDDALTEAQLKILQALSRQATQLLGCREDVSPNPWGGVGSASEAASICAWCSRVQGRVGEWFSISEFLYQRFEVPTTHGICPDCMKSTEDRQR